MKLGAVQSAKVASDSRNTLDKTGLQYSFVTGSKTLRITRRCDDRQSFEEGNETLHRRGQICERDIWG